jgi:predicted DNA-binding ribbon-helix-helix protein
MALMASAFPNPRTAPTQDSETHTALMIRNVSVCGRRTSVRLEPQLWDTLAEICRRERCTPHDVCSYVAARRRGSLTSSLRVFILDYFRTSATEHGHIHAGHRQGMFLSEQQERRQMRKLKADAMERRDESNRVPLPGRAGN